MPWITFTLSPKRLNWIKAILTHSGSISVASIYLSKNPVRLSTYLLLSSVSFATFAFAQNNNIVVDQAAHSGVGAPNIVQSSNGTDVLNIVKPTAGGVSHNKFLEYNVSDKNLILNNHAYKTGIPQGESTLGRTVAFNPNFGTGDAAKVKECFLIANQKRYGFFTPSSVVNIRTISPDM